jgi:hypothetical protein
MAQIQLTLGNSETPANLAVGMRAFILTPLSMCSWQSSRLRELRSSYTGLCPLTRDTLNPSQLAERAAVTPIFLLIAAPCVQLAPLAVAGVCGRQLRLVCVAVT